ncbi:MAG: FecR domain-containing protein [Desulfovibrionaceae bacterium]|nr:FecR domain-containing protein [Desulfovibrionaceae bacterium]MBF0512448.1 FecR domain-containing protein [Desulfovibrionaceae bacterium]
MKLHIAFACLSPLLLMSVLAAPVRAQPAAASPGLVLNIRNGNLERRSQESWETLVVGDPVTVKQRLKTGPAALAVLELPQLGRYILGPDTDVELGQGGQNATDSLKKGALWISAKLPPGNSLTVQTALASSGVRGTMFTVIAGKDGMDLCTCNGNVDVTLKDGTVVKVGTGSSCKLDVRGKPMGPVTKGALVLAKYSASSKAYGICYGCHTKTGLRKDWNENTLSLAASSAKDK